MSDGLYDALEAIRAKLRAEDSPVEDDVMELMDRVSGFCSPQSRIVIEPWRVEDDDAWVERLHKRTAAIERGHSMNCRCPVCS